MACHRCVRSRRAPSPATEKPSAGLPASSRRRLTLLESFRGAELPSPAEPTSPVPAASSPLPRRRRLLGRCPVVRRRAERGCCRKRPPPSSRWAEIAAWRDRSSPSRAAAKRRTSSCRGGGGTPAIVREPGRVCEGLVVLLCYKFSWASGSAFLWAAHFVLVGRKHWAGLT